MTKDRAKAIKRQELRRSNAARPHRNQARAAKRPGKGTRSNQNRREIAWQR